MSGTKMIVRRHQAAPTNEFYSRIIVNGQNVDAQIAADSFELVQGAGIILRPDVNKKKIQIGLDSNYAGGGNGTGGTSLSTSAYHYEVYINTVKDNAIVTSNSIDPFYIPGSNELEVFRNGIRQDHSFYNEINGRQIQFVRPLEINEKVILRVRERTGIFATNFAKEYFIVTDNGIFEFQLANSFMSTDKKLEVYYNGVLQEFGVDYFTPEDFVVRFTQPIDGRGSLILFQISDKSLEAVPKLLEQTFVTSGTNRRYTLTAFTYNVGYNELDVYVGGILYTCGEGYTEIDERTIELTWDPPAGNTLLITKENCKKSNDVMYLQDRVRRLEQELAYMRAQLGI